MSNSLPDTLRGSALKSRNSEVEQGWAADHAVELVEFHEQAPFGDHTVDRDGLFVRINDVALRWLGYAREELVGVRRIFDVLPPEHHAAMRGFFQAGCSVHGVELELIRKDGTRLPVLANTLPVKDAAGNLVRGRAILFDDTERRQALERANRAKDAFLSAISHEMRTPLHGILGLSEVLLEEIHGPLNDRQRASLHRIEACGGHLLELINDVLDWAMVGAGQLSLKLSSIPLEALCCASMDRIETAAGRKHIRTSLRVLDGSVVLLGDPDRLQQVLVILLSNAVKFTPEGGQVGLTVALDKSGEGISLTVWDTGIGIAPHDQRRLFQAFTQLDASLARQHSGAGLGLALAQRLVTLHQGSIHVESESGQGSRFVVRLPLSTHPRAPLEASP